MKKNILFTLALVIIMMISEAFFSSFTVDKPLQNEIATNNLTNNILNSYRLNVLLKNIDNACKPYSTKNVININKQKPWWVFALADAAGGFTGGATGAKLCGFWCALAGGLLGAAIASVNEYNFNSIAYTPQNTYGTSNSNNPYDSWGQLHNQVLYNVALSPNYYFDEEEYGPRSSGTLDLPKLYNLIDSLYIISPARIDSTDSIEDHFSECQFASLAEQVQSPSSDITCSLTENYNAGNIDKNTQYILGSYISNLTLLTNNTDVQNFTVATENIIDTTTVSMNKPLIFEILTISKNSYAFWSTNN